MRPTVKVLQIKDLSLDKREIITIMSPSGVSHFSCHSFVLACTLQEPLPKLLVTHPAEQHVPVNYKKNQFYSRVLQQIFIHHFKNINGVYTISNPR